MKQLIGGGISFGILGALLTEVGGRVGLLTWVVFVAMLAFCCTQGGWKGLVVNTSTNLIGVLEGMMILSLGSIIPGPYASGIACFLVVMLMCTQAHFELLNFIPGTFAGCASLFGAGNDWKSVVIALLIGNVAAMIGQTCGKLIGDFLEGKTAETVKG